MRNRRTSRQYFLYSLLIHLALLLGMWQLVPEREMLLPFHAKLEVSEIHHVMPPNVRPPIIATPLPPPEVEPAAVAEEVAEPPAPPKPSPGLNTGSWSAEEVATPHRAREDSVGKRTGIPSQPVIAAGTPRAPQVNLQPERVAPPPRQPTTDVAPRGETTPVALDSEGSMDNNVSSPTVGAPSVFYAGTRGDIFRTTGIGNSWGGGGGGSRAPANVGGIYVTLMKQIARELAAAATAEKVDVVFILDETASMSDNIRGIRAYVAFLFDAMEHDGHDTTFSLITFSDTVRTDFLHQPTDDSGTFRNWLFQIGVAGGGDLAEAGLDALMTAVTQSSFRGGAQRLFLLASDAVFHDADYDGRSAYSLDEVIETLQRQQIRVDVIGLDYLPIKQLALATGGTWHAIPGSGYGETVPPMTLTEKMLSQLGTLGVGKGTLDDTITVYVNNPPRPKRLTLTWKVLNPRGERCYGPMTTHRDIPDDGTPAIELNPTLDSAAFTTVPGVYTIIYRLENEQGHRSILRRTFTF